MPRACIRHIYDRLLSGFDTDTTKNGHVIRIQYSAFSGRRQRIIHHSDDDDSFEEAASKPRKPSYNLEVVLITFVVPGTSVLDRNFNWKRERKSEQADHELRREESK